MSTEKEATQAKEIVGLKVNSLDFRYHQGWNTSKPHWVCSARLSKTGDGYTGAKDLTIELKNELSEKLMLAILPFVVQSASESAQELANQAKELVNTLSDCIVKQLAPPSA